MPAGLPARVAVIADVHGNTWALDAVLADIDRRGIERIVALGDHAYGPLDPGGAVDRLMARGVDAVKGNEDRIGTDGLTLRQWDWLAGLPDVSEPWQGAVAFHGTADDDRSYFLWRVEKGVLRQATDDEALAAADRLARDWVLCAHDHVPRSVLGGGLCIVDPGSVGLPAYNDDHPVPHVMEAGSPHARYSVVRPDVAEQLVEHVSLEYDWCAAARAAEDNGRPDWARWLATGSAI